MPRFAANISTLFTELPFLERFEAARQAGFSAVECQFPYEAVIDEIARVLEANELELVLHNLPPGDWAAGDRGIAIFAGRSDEFRSGVQTAIDYATVLGCKQINCLAGIAPLEHDVRLLSRTLVDNLKFAADELARAGIRLLIEPINRFDAPGFFLDRVEMASDVIDEVGSPNLFIQYDLYHRQRSGGELIDTYLKYQDRISHIQIADTPGRHEPGTGEINYPNIFAALDTAGYDGWIGCEYFPQSNTVEGLGWLDDQLKR